MTTTDLQADALTGMLVRLWPYAPGVYGRDALYRVWKAMEDDGASRQAFWDEAPGETGGDLDSFVQLFAASSQMLLLIERRDTQKLCGCFWASQMQAGHQAFVGMWMEQDSRGTASVEAATLALHYTFAVGGFRQLWALTPWTKACALCHQTGFQRVGILENFCLWGESYLDVSIYRLTKEAFDGHVQKGQRRQ